jgi:hypothetical protein
MITWKRACLAGALSVLTSGCFGSSHDAGAAKGASSPPTTIAGWTYYGSGQGLSGDVHDVSADEGGNVYVAGGDALYAKGPSDGQFRRFDAANAGLTRNCNDKSEIMNPFPPKPFYLCPVISVAGAAPGRAVVGLKGLDQSADLGSTWIFKTGGADVVSFDGHAGTLSRVRHVEIGSPPHIVCGANGEVNSGTCSSPTDYWWVWGRRLLRQVFRITVNHDKSTAMYGDTWFAGNHGTFAVLLANAASRGWTDRTAGFDPEQWADAKDVWEHMHPSITSSTGAFLLGESWALSIDPRSGTPWGSNTIRTAYVVGYGPDLSGRNWWDMGPATKSAFYDLWPDSGDEWAGPTNDHVRAMSHCADGTLWIASTTHGLAKIDPSGAVSYPPLPDPAVNTGVSAIACDPSDGSIWMGLVQGGVLRLRGDTYEAADPAGAPGFAHHPVASIQVDAWSTPRVVYFAYPPQVDAAGQIVADGGVGAYAGK